MHPTVPAAIITIDREVERAMPLRSREANPGPTAADRPRCSRRPGRSAKLDGMRRAAARIAGARTRGDLPPIPVVLCLDVEPDARHVDLRAPSAWDGFPRTWELLDSCRDTIGRRSAGEPHFSWFLRMDSQVQRGYGSLSWPVDHHRALVDAIRASGDHVGLHVHAWRRDDDRDEWLIDCADTAWVNDCLTAAFDAFASAMGTRCTTFRFGERWMDQAVFARLEALGIEVDLTPEPGHLPVSFYEPGERFAGEIPDYRDVPPYPYRPSLRDYRIPDPERNCGAWVLPVTTSRVPPTLPHRLYRRFVSRRSWGDVSTALVSHHPTLFARIVDDALARPSPHLVLTLRSSAAGRPQLASRIEANLAALLSRPEAARLVWVEPAAAVRLLNPPASPAS